MKILKWIDKNTFEIDGVKIESELDFPKNQLIGIFTKHYVVIQKDEGTWYLI